MVESRSVKRNAKNLLGLGRDRAAIFPAATAPFPKSCASYFRFVRFNTFPPYYLRAWHRLRGPVLLYVIHKREIRHFHVVVVQWQQRNVQKSVMHVQSCCFAIIGDVTRDDSQGRFLAQHSVAMLEQYCNHSKQCRNNVATLCCAKNRRCESSRVTSIAFLPFSLASPSSLLKLSSEFAHWNAIFLKPPALQSGF